MVVIGSNAGFICGCLGMCVVCSRGGEVEGYVSIFTECAEELSHLCGEGYHESLWGGLVFGFVIVCLLVSVVVVGGEKSCFVGGDDVEGFPWYRCFFEDVHGIAHRKDGSIVRIACA